MKRLVESVGRVVTGVSGVRDWDEAVRLKLGQFIRRKSILRQHKELLRTELVNLAKLESFPEYRRLLLDLVRLYRRIIRVDSFGAFAYLIECFEETVRADERWITISLTYEQLSGDYTIHERVAQAFNLLDDVLEGCYKPQLRVAYGFVLKQQAGKFPANVMSLGFGQFTRLIDDAFSKRADLLVEDPDHQINVNQWRNIAAHKSYRVLDADSIEVHYGQSRPKVLKISVDSLDRTVEWAIRSLGAVRLANVIIFIEFMAELKGAGLGDPALRLESTLVGLCHNLKIVGLECLDYHTDNTTFVLVLRERLGREPLTSVIHASQALDQLSIGLKLDVSHGTRLDRVAVRLVDDVGAYVGQASVAIVDAIAATESRLSREDLTKRINFHFADTDRLKRALNRDSI